MPPPPSTSSGPPESPKQEVWPDGLASAQSIVAPAYGKPALAAQVVSSRIVRSAVRRSSGKIATSSSSRVMPQPSSRAEVPGASAATCAVSISATGATGACGAWARCTSATSEPSSSAEKAGFHDRLVTGMRWPPEPDSAVWPSSTSQSDARVSTTQCAAVRNSVGAISVPVQDWPAAGVDVAGDRARR